MSFLDRIKGSGHDKNADVPTSGPAEPFDELSPPATFEMLAATVVDRALELAGLQVDTYRWNEK